ncbi:Putative Dihydrolipoamide dehydrogenase; Mercuric ion reductase; PF00070 family, FAD-dependent NAD(P)-disulphide oxidoreductase [Helicobacter heilmannii]|uniref:FAD-dependent oxidoreductase n=1 Tax=Helicobacter heilmannii TaxID=35817 RepID=UPI0006A0FB22|nr:FAD-dependent oxidoreductase [Helicobacter heilmannii]CRF48885.1 Putative Dihydrolipoamide dehydrogenase; Mercuric ion reductase; PF00070 family, FAD-dependent NAD(P)-disulphide oxidoreductase [Helicobacter heilmannii]
MQFAYDLVVIGFGKGGKTLAVAVAKLGKKVALVEANKDMYGGTCINVGCIPSKTLLHLATHKKGQAGYKEAIEAKNKLTALLRQKNYEALLDAKVQVIDGMASFKDSHTLMLYHNDSCQEISAQYIVINTGSISTIPRVPIHSDKVYDSTSLMQLANLPAHLVVVGGGYIGLEFASMFNLFGRTSSKHTTKVSVLVRGSEFLPKEDPIFSQSIHQSLSQKGVQIITNTTLNAIEDNCVHYTQDKQAKTLKADAILLATGRVPNTATLQLERADVVLGDKQEILTNEFLVANPQGEGNIYAIGDVKGGPMFTYVSLDDFRIVYDHLYGAKRRSTQNRHVLPEVLYIETPYSHVGLRAYEVKDKVFSTHSLKTAAIPGARVLEDTTGLLQVLVEEHTERILGASLHCPLSYEYINLFSLAINQNLPFFILKDMIYTHPSIMESLNTL